MSQPNSDTRATAYIFGELSPQQTAIFEAELGCSPELQAEVASIREAIAAVKADFNSQPMMLPAAQRETVQRAIRGETPVTPPPVERVISHLEHRRFAIYAAVAATVLVACGLAYPYLRSRSLETISMVEAPKPVHDNRHQPAVETATPGQTGQQQTTDLAEVDREVAQLVDAFNDLVEDRRFEEAEVVAQQVKKLKPSDPIATSMFDVATTGQSLQQTEQTAAAKELAFVDRSTAPTPSASEPTAVAAPSLPELSLPEAQQWQSLSRRRGAGLPSDEAVPSEPRPVDRSITVTDDAPEFANGLALQAEMPSEDSVAKSGKGESTDLSITTLDSKLRKQPQRRSRRTAPEAEMEGMMLESMEMDVAGTSPLDYESSLMDMDMGMSMGMGMGMAMGDAGAAGMGGAAIDGGMEAMGMGMEMGAINEAPGRRPSPHSAAEGDRFDPIVDNAFVDVAQQPLSTFSIDVDTASYTKIRSLLKQNTLPRPDAVRIEEMLNYFSYNYPPPQDEHPFAAAMEIASCPWHPQHRLARIGIKGKVIEEQRPLSNLVFLLDVSGSMNQPNKLPLVIEGMKMLTSQLGENDSVAIVVYAGAAGLVLDSTGGDKKDQIIAALDRLSAGGSTNGGQGIQLAYQVARENFIVGGTNRVILCSDGDFNVGVTGTDELVRIATENAQSNIFLSVLGFGIGNHNDAMMEQVSNRANGNYAFIDSAGEARKVLVEELGGTLVTIAKDVKIQIEFNPKQIASYRLIGYENRVLAAEDFNDDKKDAGEIGAGHTVTALYELVPREVDDAGASSVDRLRYQQPGQLSEAAASGETLTLKLRYKQPEGETSRLIEFPVTDTGKTFAQADRDFKFAASVAAFGMLLGDSPHRGTATLQRVASAAAEGAQGDPTGYRQEFVELVTKARQLRGQ